MACLAILYAAEPILLEYQNNILIVARLWLEQALHVMAHVEQALVQLFVGLLNMMHICCRLWLKGGQIHRKCREM
jgi:hypothetical protein